MSRWASLGTLAVLVLVLPGCASLPWGQQARTDDPLKGDTVASDVAPPPKAELKPPKSDVQPPPGARKLASFTREPAAAPSTPRTLAPSPAALVAATPKPIHNDTSLAIENTK